MAIGTRITELLDEKNWRQKDLSDASGVDRRAIGMIIKRDGKSTKHLSDLAVALGVTERWLATGREPKYRPSGPPEGRRAFEKTRVVDVDLLEDILKKIAKRSHDTGVSPGGPQQLAQSIASAYNQLKQGSREYTQNQLDKIFDEESEYPFDIGEDEGQWNTTDGWKKS